VNSNTDAFLLKRDYILFACSHLLLSSEITKQKGVFGLQSWTLRHRR